MIFFWHCNFPRWTIHVTSSEYTYLVCFSWLYRSSTWVALVHPCWLYFGSPLQLIFQILPPKKWLYRGICDSRVVSYFSLMKISQFIGPLSSKFRLKYKLIIIDFDSLIQNKNWSIMIPFSSMSWKTWGVYLFFFFFTRLSLGAKPETSSLFTIPILNYCFFVHKWLPTTLSPLANLFELQYLSFKYNWTNHLSKTSKCCALVLTRKSSNNRVIRKVSLCFDRFRVHYSHKPMETQSKALEFRGIIHKARV